MRLNSPSLRAARSNPSPVPSSKPLVIIHYQLSIVNCLTPGTGLLRA
ncbi:MAG: hypothetical protein LBM98_06995 [Oscillospiraceae bacterium]|nr:hypothetical protein [Oscillospiraceae bacterium]